ncbi:MAG: hypothetical protein HQL39_20190, partial [Alphaproteobacteria bacterium]|nr:hypothetical protein [Alphaproteobacteria bacterium]
SVVMALGAGLTVLVTVASVEAVAVRHLNDGLPRQAPALFFLNLPPDAGSSLPAPGAERLRVAPFVHSRLTRVEGRPVHRLRLPGDVSWVVRGDRGLSWAAEPP